MDSPTPPSSTTSSPRLAARASSPFAPAFAPMWRRSDSGDTSISSLSEVARKSPPPHSDRDKAKEKALAERLTKVAGNAFISAYELVVATISVDAVSYELKAMWRGLWEQSSEGDREKIALQLFIAAYSEIGTYEQQVTLREFCSEDIGREMLITALRESPGRLVEFFKAQYQSWQDDLCEYCLTRLGGEFSVSQIQEYSKQLLGSNSELSFLMKARITGVLPRCWRNKIDYYAIAPVRGSHLSLENSEPDVDRWIRELHGYAMNTRGVRHSSLKLFSQYIHKLLTTPGVVQERGANGEFLKCVIPGRIRGQLRRYLSELYNYKKTILDTQTCKLLFREQADRDREKEALAFVFMEGLFESKFYFPDGSDLERSRYLSVVNKIVTAIVEQNSNDWLLDRRDLRELPEVVKDQVELVALLLYVHPMNHHRNPSYQFDDVYADDNGAFVSMNLKSECTEKNEGYKAFPLCDSLSLDLCKLQGTSDIVVPVSENYAQVFFVYSPMSKKVICIPVKAGDEKRLPRTLNDQFKKAGIKENASARVVVFAINQWPDDENGGSLDLVFADIPGLVPVTVFYPNGIDHNSGAVLWSCCSLEDSGERQGSVLKMSDAIHCGFRLHCHNNSLEVMSYVDAHESGCDSKEALVVRDLFYDTSTSSFLSATPDAGLLKMVASSLSLAVRARDDMTASPAFKKRMVELSELDGISRAIQSHALNSTHVRLAYSGLQTIRYGLRCPYTYRFPEQLVVPAMDDQGLLCEAQGVQGHNGRQPLAPDYPCAQLVVSLSKLNCVGKLSKLDELQRLPANIRRMQTEVDAEAEIEKDVATDKEKTEEREPPAKRQKQGGADE